MDAELREIRNFFFLCLDNYNANILYEMDRKSNALLDEHELFGQPSIIP